MLRQKSLVGFGEAFVRLVDAHAQLVVFGKKEREFGNPRFERDLLPRNRAAAVVNDAEQ